MATLHCAYGLRASDSRYPERLPPETFFAFCKTWKNKRCGMIGHNKRPNLHEKVRKCYPLDTYENATFGPPEHINGRGIFVLRICDHYIKCQHEIKNESPNSET